MDKSRDSFVVQGLGKRAAVSGIVKIGGAKNAVLQALAFSVLFKDGYKIKNVPGIEDVKRMCELLHDLGIETERAGDEIEVKVGKEIGCRISKENSRKMRASIVLTGPILARLGRVIFPHPGGCVIGNRPIDIFLDAYERLGAKIKIKKGEYLLETEKGGLTGAEIFSRIPTVTGTQTFMMAGVLARGKTIIKNCALEPETETLAEFLNSCGAKISGAGTKTITIEGAGLLSGKGRTFVVPPDRIETGSYLIFGALCAGNLEIINCDPKHLEALIWTLKNSGVNLKMEKNSITVNNKNKKNYKKSAELRTLEYPGFPTDLQASMMVFLTQARGESLVYETVFEGRLNYVDGLIKMGADIKLWDAHRATVIGPTGLHGKELEGTDIRAGLAYIIAAVAAEGESVIHNAHHIDRGYERVEEKLKNLGVKIKRRVEGSTT